MLSILQKLGMFEDITADLYPYRFVITPLLISGLLLISYLAYRRGLHRVPLRHGLATLLIGVPAFVIVIIAADYLVSPLWERTRLEEASPLITASALEAPAPATRTETSVQPRVLLTGTFMGSDDFHFGHGDAQLIQTGPNTYVLRFENFSVRNGPDLYVYLSENRDGETVMESLNLGKLKATDGAFNYEIPANVDVSKVKSAVVWCRQFAVRFAHAELERS